MYEFEGMKREMSILSYMISYERKRGIWRWNIKGESKGLLL